MDIRLCYKALAADWQGALRRFGSPEAVQRFLCCFREDESLMEMIRGLDASDVSLAYRAAHTLKGTAGMLGLTQLMHLAEEICLALRSGYCPSGRQRQALEQCQERVMAYIAALPMPQADFSMEEGEVLRRCFACMPGDVQVLEAATGRCIYGHGEAIDVPSQLVWDAAWLGRGGQQGEVTVWPYAPGYAVLRYEKSGRSDLLSMVSHDIRMPLHVITGMAAAARDSRADTARLRRCLDRIHLAGEHLKSMVGSMLDNTGQEALCREPFSLPEVLHRVISLMQDESASRRQRLSLRLDCVTHEHVTGDPNRLMRIVLNLLTNAIKYTEPGGWVELRCREAFPGRYVLTVQDSGTGMTDTFIHRAFEPYARGKDTGEEGQGLGLAIVRQLVDMMEGDVAVHSVRGAGTAVQVTLPLAPAEETALPDLRGLRVLLAEDHPLCAQATALMLEQEGILVHTVASAEEAAAYTGFYECALVDLHLRQADGCQVGRYLQQRRGVPVLVLSGDSSFAARQSIRAAGLQGLLVKPIDREQLVRAIGETMKRKT